MDGSLPAAQRPLRILGIGGTTRAGSSTEKALRFLGRQVAASGAQWEMICGPQLVLPVYGSQAASMDARRLVEALRQCDAVAVGSPGYHGLYSGLVKNAMEYAEELAGDERPRLSGRAFGCIATGYGWQAIGTTLSNLRTVAHALGAWTTPASAAINSSQQVFGADGDVVDAEARADLCSMAEQLVEFAAMRRAFCEQREASEQRRIPTRLKLAG